VESQVRGSIIAQLENLKTTIDEIIPTGLIVQMY
jgi:hypothetical protein